MVEETRMRTVESDREGKILVEYIIVEKYNTITFGIQEKVVM